MKIYYSARDRTPDLLNQRQPCHHLSQRGELLYLTNVKILHFWKTLYSSLVFSPRAGPSLPQQEPRLQFCRRQIFHRKLRNQGCSFTRDWIGALASGSFPHLTLSLTSQQTLKDLKRSQRHQRGCEECGFGQLGPPDFTEIQHRG